MVYDLVVILLIMNMVPTLSTLTVTESLKIFMLLNNGIMNITSFTVFERLLTQPLNSKASHFSVFLIAKTPLHLEHKVLNAYASSDDGISSIITTANSYNFPGFLCICG